jgi:hypothetical protein
LTTEEVKYLKELVAAGKRGRTIAAPNRREVLKRLVEAGYVVSRPMSYHTVHYMNWEKVSGTFIGLQKLPDLPTL